MIAEVTTTVPGRRVRDAAIQWRRCGRLGDARARRYTSVGPAEQAIAARLLTLTTFGWVLLVDRRWPSPGGADMILIGPPGVFIIDVSNRSRPIRDDLDLAEVAQLLRVTDVAEDAAAAEHVAPAALTPMIAFARQEINDRTGPVWLIGAGSLVSTLVGLPRRLTGDAIAALTTRLGAAFPAFTADSLSDAAPVSDPIDPAALFDSDEVARAQLCAELAEPVEAWMTYLHADQLSLVRRRFGGPARISGAPGTGKTVVGLHRAAYLAQHTSGRVLFVNVLRTLPRVQARLFSQLAPALVDRVEFTALHAWALALLTERGFAPHLDGVEECFDLAWEKVGVGGPLEQVDASMAYWRDEIAYVIKGRGVSDVDTYLELARPGRKTALQRAHRQAVWDLYTEYEKLKHDRGLHDHADVLQDALNEVRRRPVTPAYAAVIADEVQDLSLTAVKLLHALVGDAPDGLLLIGDGQQAVLPVGFHLAEAHIAIRGARSETLRRNYRNAPEILRAALSVAAQDPDAERPDVESTQAEGRVVNVVTRTGADLDRALLGIVSDLAEVGRRGLAGVAVLCARAADVHRYAQLFDAAGIPVRRLADYDGRREQAVLLGTIMRSKGLEFPVVLLPRFNEPSESARDGGYTEADQVALAHRQLYVAMSRARELLWLGQVRPS